MLDKIEVPIEAIAAREILDSRGRPTVALLRVVLRPTNYAMMIPSVTVVRVS